MKKLSDYLDRAAEITGSDYRTAQRLNLTRSAISKCRSEGTMKTVNVVALAELIGENPALIVASCDVAKNPENKEIWKKWGAIAGVTMALMAGMTGKSFEENQIVMAEPLTDNLYVMRIVIMALILALVVVLWSGKVSDRRA